MVRRRKRIDFISYYRFVISTGFTDLLTCIMIIMSNAHTHSEVIDGQIIYIFFLIIELIIVELYLRYLDAVQIAKNDIARGKLMLMRYLNSKNDGGGGFINQAINTDCNQFEVAPRSFISDKLR